MVESLVFTSSLKAKCAGCYDIRTWRYFSGTIYKMERVIFTRLCVSSLAALLLFFLQSRKWKCSFIALTNALSIIFTRKKK